MVHWLSTRDPGFEAAFSALLAAKREPSDDVGQAVAAIVRDVRERGDQALIELTRRLDRFELTADAIRLSDAEIEAAVADCPAEVRQSLEFAAARIAAYHRRQRPADERFTDETGIELGHRWTPVEAAGLYVPGGLNAYPSSVLMNAVPARVAGVARIAMAVPTPHGVLDPQVVAAARIAGVHEIYRVGGAQAIAALAYGTETVAPVSKIVGPGNAYVAEAKRQVFGTVGIDMIAGPSEVVIMADGDNDPEWLAADLLAQAEHDASAQSILVTDSEDLAKATAAAVARQLEVLPRREHAGASWSDFGAIIVVDSLRDAIALVDRLAPEHLEIAATEAEALAATVRNAGAIFIGRFTPEAIGDYVAGPNHVLPTARTARFSSGLNLLDFMKRTSILKLDAQGLRTLSPHAVTLARAEGLEAHARSIAVRLGTT
ncbi:MAG: histidinol dehydrogenase [Hyphomicrobiales bacterium]